MTDSTKVIKIEIDTSNRFERIFYIDYAVNSPAKDYIKDFGSSNWDKMESPAVSYSRILNNLEQKPAKINSQLPDNWVRIYKYEGNWILYYDYVTKYILSDSSLITFFIDGPVSSIIGNYKTTGNRHDFKLYSYDPDNPAVNRESKLQIKILDSEHLISIWKFIYNDQVSYELLVPADKASVFPIMVIMSTDLTDDETDIFDKVDLEKLWKGL